MKSNSFKLYYLNIAIRPAFRLIGIGVTFVFSSFSLSDLTGNIKIWEPQDPATANELSGEIATSKIDQPPSEIHFNYKTMSFHSK